MHSHLKPFADPMIVVLLLATVLAFVIPAVGEARAQAQTVSSASIFVLFLVNGMRIARGDVLRASANWRFFAPLVIFVFVVMALMGTGLSHVAQLVLPAEIALGFIFLGVLPSTVQSATSYTTLAGGNAALSVVGAALINILGVFVSAPLFAVLAGGDAVNLGTDTILRIGMIMFVPFAIGQCIQGWTMDWLSERKRDVVWLDRIVIAVAVYVAMSGAVEMGLLDLISPTRGAWLLALVVGYLAVSHALAWWTARRLGYPREDCIAFFFAAPQKSVAIGASLGAILFPAEIAGFVIATLLVYHFLQLVLAAPLATRLARGTDRR